MPIRSSDTVVNGYFYTYMYYPTWTNGPVDNEPLIYCIGPSLKSLNCFIGLNLHHLPVTQREQLISKMQSTKNFMRNGVRTLFTEEELNSLVPGCKIAVREYNKTKVFNCYRIDNEDIPYYIYSDGMPVEENRKTKLMDFLLKKKLYSPINKV
jgi:hypothetical protein